MAALLCAVLLPALLAALISHIQTVQTSLSAHLARHDAETAAVLAALLAPVQHDHAALQSLAASLNKGGAYLELMVRTPTGDVVFSHKDTGAGDAASGATPPAWFNQLFAVTTLPGHAPLAAATATSQGLVSSAGPVGLVSSAGPVGLVRVESSTVPAQAALWRSAQSLAWSLALLGASAAAAAALLLSWWREPLARLSARARAVTQTHSHQTPYPQPHWPELQEITHALDVMELRAGEQFASQAEVLARLQLRAQTDHVTGLALRQPFIGRLQDAMAHGHAPSSGLLLLRVGDLQAANHSHGHGATDHLLRLVADLMLTYVERVPGTMAGRLNGRDFALFLPAPGVVQETAQSIQAALQATPSARIPGIRFLFGGCESAAGTSTSAALATADAALARAEAGEGLLVLQPETLLSGGSRAWHDCIAQALEPHPLASAATGVPSTAGPMVAGPSVRLTSYPVVDENGSLVHHECLMRLQARPRGEWLKAQSWLALARRSGLMDRVDWMAMDLALKACAQDQQPRCIHVSLHSFTNPEFAPGLLARVQAAGPLARLLSIEWSEAMDAQAEMRPDLRMGLCQAVAQWHAHGVRVGVEHAGSTPKILPSLREMGVDYIKVDARHIRGAHADAAVHSYAACLVSAIQNLGMQAMAQGVDNEADLATLQALGFDAFTGPAVQLHPGGTGLQPPQDRPTAAAPVQAQQSVGPCTPALADLALVHDEGVGLAVGKEQSQGLTHGAEGQFVPRHFVFLEQPRLKGLRPWV